MTSKKEIEHNYNVMFKANDKYWRNKHAADIEQIFKEIEDEMNVEVVVCDKLCRIWYEDFQKIKKKWVKE